jgi:CheY-like chemotaxis protein
MVNETGNPKNIDGSNNSSEYLYHKNRKVVEKYSIIVLILLIASIILLSFKQNLAAGCLIFAAASIGLVIVRRATDFIVKSYESVKVYSSLNEKKDEVIKEFSHKIREPLNNLVILADTLMESGLQKKQKDLFETFIASTNNMVTILNELTMQSAGNLSFERRKSIRFNLLSTIQNTIELYNLKEKQNIDFILNKKEFADFECLGDPIVLKQIFLDLFNTIENKHTDRPVKVNISLNKSRLSETESTIALRIQTDNNFLLIDESGQAAKLIASGGGNFSQESGADHSILNINLPFSNPVAETKEIVGSSKIAELKSREKTTKELKDLKILLVEDNIINQKITLLTLKPLVYNIDTASNGKEALDKFGTSNYDIILMDIQMPVMSGLTAAEKIRALESTTHSHIPIIAITANAMIGDKEKCLSAGIDDYISKPFQPAALIEKIKNNI